MLESADFSLEGSPGPRTERNGFTLVEILVVLVLFTLVFALSAPSLLPSAPAGSARAQDLIDEARRTAVTRAMAVSLSLGSDGRWVLAGAGVAGTQLGSGAIDWPQEVPMRVHISPLGACHLEAAGVSGSAFTIDPVRCRLTGP